MSHEHRIWIWKCIKHAASYALKLLMQTVSNTWQMFVTQQLIATGAIGVVAGFIYYRNGLVTFDATAQNAQAFLAIVGITVIAVVILGLIRSPFQLDREHLERIVTITAGSDAKDRTINTLKLTVKTLESGKPNTIINQYAKAAPRPVSIPNIPQLEMEIDIWGFVFGGNGIVRKTQSDDYPEGRAISIILQSKIQKGNNSTLKFKTIIKFRGDAGGSKTVRGGIWLNQHAEHIFIGAGEFADVVIALEMQGKLHSYEYHSEYFQLAISDSDLLIPVVNELPESEYDVVVQFVGQHHNTIVVDETKKFRLTLSPFQITPIV